MNIKKISTALIVLGFLGLAASILVDIIKTGELKIQSAQILVIEVSALLIVFGALCRQLSTKAVDGKINSRNISQKLYDIPLSLWGMIGFLITFFSFFLTPMFFDPSHRIHYFNKYLPDRYPIGADILLLTDSIKQWFASEQSPYSNTQFPQYSPFAYIFFSPLTLISNIHFLYRLITILTFICFILSSLIIPLLMIKSKERSLIALFFVSGLLSYGMQFELERAQFNIITFTFCIAAVYIYHFHHSFRRFAYLLFVIAVQLKLYPAIFIFMFIKDWKDWKGNLRRLIILGLVNFLLLFIAGLQSFLGFVNLVKIQLSNPGLSWTGNHSIKAFLSEFVENNGFDLISTESVHFFQQHINGISNLFLIIFLASILSAILRAYRMNQQGIDALLLLTCSIGALIIPVSNDYTLPIITTPMALAFLTISNNNHEKRKIAIILFLILTTASYSALLYPFKYKPLYLQNSFPLLFLLLITSTSLNLMTRGPNSTNRPAELTSPDNLELPP